VEETFKLAILFLVPAVGNEHLLEQRVAGLSLAERICHHTQRSGIDHTLLAVSDTSGMALPGKFASCRYSSFHELDRLHIELCIVCKPGILPDKECLEWLKAVEVEPHQVAELSEGLFVFRPSDIGFELERAFEPDGYHKLLDFLHTFLVRKPLACQYGTIYDLTSPDKIKKAEKVMFRSLIKDTEGFMSRFVERRISLAISRRLVNTSITPNQVTVISVFIGLLGAWLISLGTGFWQVSGAILFLAHSIIDGCDGEIARIKFMESRLGGILDFWGDNIVHAAVFAAIGLEWWGRTGAVFPLFLSATAVTATFISALLISVSTMTKKDGKGPMYTSVSASKKKARVVKIADFLSRRDFIYLVVILAFFQHLDWFLVASAIGTMVFVAMLVWIRLKD